MERKKALKRELLGTAYERRQEMLFSLIWLGTEFKNVFKYQLRCWALQHPSLFID